MLCYCNIRVFRKTNQIDLVGVATVGSQACSVRMLFESRFHRVNQSCSSGAASKRRVLSTSCVDQILFRRFFLVTLNYALFRRKFI